MIMRSILEADDRTNFVPKHEGASVLPNFYLFTRLVRLASKGKLLAVKDLTFGYTASYTQLLSDVLHLRTRLLDVLSPPVKRMIENGEEVSINLLGPGGYEFVVGFLAIVALGCITVPICASSLSSSLAMI